MATFIKGTDCGCPDCATTPCGTGCVCSFFAFQSGDETDLPYFDSWDVTADFASEHGLFIQWDAEVGPGDSGVRFVVKADGSTVFDSGCLVGDSGSTTVTIPAGTATISVEITNCGSSTAVWGLDISCA